MICGLSWLGLGVTDVLVPRWLETEYYVFSLSSLGRDKMTDRTTVVIALGMVWLFWFIFFYYLGV